MVNINTIQKTKKDIEKEWNTNASVDKKCSFVNTIPIVVASALNLSIFFQSCEGQVAEVFSKKIV